jgi:hypothetical protein
MRALEAQNCVVGETGSENCRLTQETDAKLFIFVRGAVYTARSDVKAVCEPVFFAVPRLPSL